MILPARVRQFRDHIVPDRTMPELPLGVEAALTPAGRARFRTLPAADQRHLLATHRILCDQGAERATCLAGLLHDIGKTDGARRAGVTARIANVLLRRWHPGWHRALAARTTVPRALIPLHLAAAHARLGAEWLALEGYPPRVCWLVQHHEGGPEADDNELAMLVAADEAADSSSIHFGERGAACTGFASW